MSISKRIAIIRGQKSLTQFAREHQTTPQNIHRYERGRNPSADFLTSLVSKGININWVLTGEGVIYVKKQKASRMALLASELERVPEEFREASAGNRSGSRLSASSKPQATSDRLVP